MNVDIPLPSIVSVGEGLSGLITGHMDSVFRVAMQDPGLEITPQYLRLITGEPHPFGNFVCMPPAATRETAARAADPLAKLSAPSAVLFTGPVPDRAHDDLLSLGFTFAGGMPAMAVEIAKIPRAPLPEGYSFARVTSTSDRLAWGEVFSMGYEIPFRAGASFTKGITGDAAPDAPLQYFWIRKGNTPVCTCAFYLASGLAGIYCVSTLPEERGKGLGGSITAECLSRAGELGYRVGVLQSSEMGHSVYRRLGFSDFGAVPLYLRIPG